METDLVTHDFFGGLTAVLSVGLKIKVFTVSLFLGGTFVCSQRVMFGLIL